MEERELTRQTILRHFFKIKQEFPKTDFSSIKPDAAIISKVKEAIKNSEEDIENTSQKFIYEYNNEEITYDNIRLAMLFID